MSRLFAFFMVFWLFEATILCVSYADPAGKRMVRVGVFDFEPVIFPIKDQDHRAAAGIYADVIEAIAQREGWTIEYVFGTWAEGLQRLERGEIDLMPSIAYSEERSRRFDFTGESMLNIWGEVYVRPGSRIRTILDLKGKRVAGMKGDINLANFQKYATQFGVPCQVVEVPSHEDVMRMVERGEADGGVIPNVFGIFHLDRYRVVPSSIMFAPFAIYWATAEGRNRELRDRIDRLLREWKKAPNSPYHSALKKWLKYGEKKGVPVWMIIAMVILVIGVILFIFWNQALHRLVRRRTASLRESESRMQAILNSVIDAIITFDPESGKISMANDSFFKMFAIPAHDHTFPLNFYDRFPEQGKFARRRFKEQCSLKKDEEFIAFEWFFESHDHPFHAEIHGQPLVLGEKRLITLVIRDVTLAKSLENQIRQAQKMEAIGTLAGGIAHDFNNILAGIIGFAELLRIHLEKGKKELYLHDLDEIMKASLRARDLIAQILTISRKKESCRTPTQLKPIVLEAVKFIRATLPANITIHADEVISDSWVAGDAVQLHQVLMNLCTNAYHAMEKEGGDLYVRLKDVYVDANSAKRKLSLREGLYIRLEVEDTGIGMDHQTMEKIFEPYFTTKEQGKGTGLGLAVIHGIVSSHGGGIYAYSEPGHGTIFHVYLPVVPSPGEVMEQTQEDTGNYDEGKGCRILLVDDERAITDFLTTTLEEYSYTVKSTCLPLQALEWLDGGEQFDVLITDLMMPEMTGIDLIRRIRSQGITLPAIICSGYGRLFTEELGQELAPIVFLEKPVVINTLREHIRKFIHDRQTVS